MGMENFVKEYENNVAERSKEGVPPLALNIAQTKQVIEILKGSDETHKAFCKDLLANRINPGVDDSAKLKAEFLGNIANGTEKCSVISSIMSPILLSL